MKVDYKTGTKIFRSYAAKHGYTCKVVGDDAYRKPRRHKGEQQHRQVILLSLRDGVLVYEDTKGRHNINQG